MMNIPKQVSHSKIEKGLEFNERNRFCTRSLLRESLDYSLIDKIPGRPNDRKTLLGELNWIFTAATDTIVWNVLPHDLFQRLFRQDLLVASLFRNFLLAERIMRSANYSPISYPMFAANPSTSHVVLLPSFKD
ncbi:hypothetical protein MLD38_021509 [Melastoma candidum]|uniref:Uncharacterized protein n=1 Tax=Melastoma candidum TaxID=119954 RepID=A0ACB9QGD8_9MYRT|nr:hypothetical protein MLD38_021509 [Melastoma candidum]